MDTNTAIADTALQFWPLAALAVGSLVAPLGGLGGSGLAMAVVMAACALLAPTVTTVLLRRPA